MSHNYRQALLQAIAGELDRGAGLRKEHVLKTAGNAYNSFLPLEEQQALLTVWDDLFRTGYLSWGYDLNNADPPSCHVTEKGRGVLARLSRDPSNPEGYRAFLATSTSLGDVAQSYVEESLATFNGGHYRAAAVMLGCAAETLLLELRDTIAARLKANGTQPPHKLLDWKPKTVLDAARKELDPKKTLMPATLTERLDSFWPALDYILRSVRNDAGHPGQIALVTEDRVHAALLIFPEHARFMAELTSWVTSSF